MTSCYDFRTEQANPLAMCESENTCYRTLTGSCSDFVISKPFPYTTLPIALPGLISLSFRPTGVLETEASMRYLRAVVGRTQVEGWIDGKPYNTFLEELACGHSRHTDPHIDSMKSRRRVCHQCNPEWQASARTVAALPLPQNSRRPRLSLEERVANLEEQFKQFAESLSTPPVLSTHPSVDGDPAIQVSGIGLSAPCSAGIPSCQNASGGTHAETGAPLGDRPAPPRDGNQRQSQKERDCTVSTQSDPLAIQVSDRATQGSRPCQSARAVRAGLAPRNLKESA